jgi:hypothetical protein
MAGRTARTRVVLASTDRIAADAVGLAVLKAAGANGDIMQRRIFDRNRLPGRLSWDWARTRRKPLISRPPTRPARPMGSGHGDSEAGRLQTVNRFPLLRQGIRPGRATVGHLVD